MLMNKEMQGDYKIERREKRESVERKRCPCCNIWCCTQVRVAEQRVQECSETTIERSGFAPLLLTNQKEASPAFETQKEDWLAPRRVTVMWNVCSSPLVVAWARVNSNHSSKCSRQTL